MDANAVGREYPDGFGYKRLGFLQGQSIGTAGDTVVSVQDGNIYIVRQVTLSNFSGAATGADVGVHTSTAAGGTDVADTQTLTGASSTASYVNLTLSAAANANVFTAPALYFNVNAAASGVTCDVAIYGDIVTL
jgi:hypothetical protein